MASKEGAKGKWKKGQRVEVHGLQGAAHLNGCQGAVLEWLKPKTRRVTPSPPLRRRPAAKLPCATSSFHANSHNAAAGTLGPAPTAPAAAAAHVAHWPEPLVTNSCRRLRVRASPSG